MSSPLYQLELDTKYANQTCGLCGDFNGDPVLNEFVSHGEPHVSPPLCSSSSHCTPCKAVFQGPKPDGSTWGARMHTHTGLHWCAVPTCRHAHTHSPGTHVHTQSRSPAITDLLPVGPCHCLLALESTAKPWPCVTVPAAAQSPRPHQARETSHDAHI